MTRGDQPAYPTTAMRVGLDGSIYNYVKPGMTIRERCEVAIMQGMTANSETCLAAVAAAEGAGVKMEDIIALWARRQAAAWLTLAELEKGTGDEAEDKKAEDKA